MEVLSGDRGMSGVNGGEMRGLDRPAMVVRGPCDAQALVGGRVLLKATYMGHPEPKVIWNRAGHELRNDERTSITSGEGVSCLLLQDITPDDSGKYGICVENLHGADCSYASVSVEGPPYPPSGRPSVTPHPDGCGATVAWSSCPFDGGSIVTGYLVESTLAGSEVWSTVTEHCLSLSHQVRGLQPGARYVFRVRAVNVHGASTPGMESEQILMEEVADSMTFEPRVVVLEPGPEFKLRFEVLEEIGKGRFGVVHKVIDKIYNQKFAAKFIKCRTTKDKDKVQDEIDIMNMLRHPKLLQLASAYENQRDIVMVTEFITGGELFERVVADDFTLTEKDCILFMRQIMEGVAYMHGQSVVHLDLKPENIMCHTRTSHQVKIIDFGLAQKLYPGQPIRVLFGTPEFAPPEIVSYEPIGVESDMWSLGVICYVLLSGLSPFMGDNDAETFANITRADYDFDDEAFNAVSQNARDFISALLVKRKEDRLSAEQCLKHTWLDPANHQETVVISTDKLKKFIIRRKWQKTGNAIRALGRMANLSASRRNSANNSASNTPRPSISDNTSRMSSLNEEELQQVSLEEPEMLDNDKVLDEITSTTPFSECDVNPLDKVLDNNEINEHLNGITQNDTLLKIDTENVKEDTDTKELKGKVCSERSDSGFSDCSVQVTSNSGSCTSTPLLSKKFPINEEPEVECNSSIEDVTDFISEKTLVLEMSKQKQDLSSGNSVASDDSRHHGEEYSKHEYCELIPKNNNRKLSSKIETYTNNCNQNKCKSASSLTSLQRLSIYSSSSVASAIKLFDHREPADVVTAQQKDPGALKSDPNSNNHVPKKDNQVQTKFSFSSAAPINLQKQTIESSKKTEQDRLDSPPRNIIIEERKSSFPKLASPPSKDSHLKSPEKMDDKPISKVDSLVQKLGSKSSEGNDGSSTVQLNASSSFRKSIVTLPSSDMTVRSNASGKETARKNSIVNSNTTSKPKSESFQKAAAFWNSPKT